MMCGRTERQAKSLAVRAKMEGKEGEFLKIVVSVDISDRTLTYYFSNCVTLHKWMDGECDMTVGPAVEVEGMQPTAGAKQQNIHMQYGDHLHIEFPQREDLDKRNSISWGNFRAVVSWDAYSGVDFNPLPDDVSEPATLRLEIAKERCIRYQSKTHGQWKDIPIPTYKRTPKEKQGTSDSGTHTTPSSQPRRYNLRSSAGHQEDTLAPAPAPPPSEPLKPVDGATPSPLIHFYAQPLPRQHSIYLSHSSFACLRRVMLSDDRFLSLQRFGIPAWSRWLSRYTFMHRSPSLPWLRKVMWVLVFRILPILGILQGLFGLFRGWPMIYNALMVLLWPLTNGILQLIQPIMVVIAPIVNLLQPMSTFVRGITAIAYSGWVTFASSPLVTSTGALFVSLYRILKLAVQPMASIYLAVARLLSTGWGMAVSASVRISSSCSHAFLVWKPFLSRFEWIGRGISWVWRGIKKLISFPATLRPGVGAGTAANSGAGPSGFASLVLTFRGWWQRFQTPGKDLLVSLWQIIRGFLYAIIPEAEEKRIAEEKRSTGGQRSPKPEHCHRRARDVETSGQVISRRRSQRLMSISTQQ